MTAIKYILIFLIPILAMGGPYLFPVSMVGISLYAYRSILIGAFILLLTINPRLSGFESPTIRYFVILGACWASWGAASLFWAENSAAALKETAAVLFGFLPIIIISLLNGFTAKGLGAFQKGWIVAYILAAMVGVWELGTGSHLPSSYVDNAPDYALLFMTLSTFGNPNNFAAFCVLLTSMFLVRLLYGKGKFNAIFYAALIGSALAFSLVSLSRLSVLGILILIALALLLRFKTRSLFFAVTFAGSIFMGWIAFENPYHEPEPNYTITTNDASTEVRINLYKSGIYLLFDTNLRGVGAGNFAHWIEQKRAPYDTKGIVNPHNYLVEIASQYGVIILIMFLLYLIHLLKVAIKYYRLGQSNKDQEMIKASATLGLGLVAFALASLSNSGWILVPYSSLFLVYLTSISSHLEKIRQY